ncbi:hypothetical protein SESBI_31571 [Sesbania bispinosa]|nr:hypothetical protein SESBI_31571 [Sesbania bispinosa]
MDECGVDSINLDDDRDLDFNNGVSSDDIGNEQHNEVGDKNDPRDVIVTNKQSRRIMAWKLM